MKARLRQLAKVGTVAVMLSPVFFMKADVQVGRDSVQPIVRVADAELAARSGLKTLQKAPGKRENEDEGSRGSWLGWTLVAVGTARCGKQVWKTVKKQREGDMAGGTGDFSLGAYGIDSVGTISHLKYRILQNCVPAIYGNAIALTYNAVIMGLKIRGNRLAAGHGRNLLHNDYCAKLKGIEDAVEGISSKAKRLGAKVLLAPLLTSNRLKQKIIDKMDSDWDMLVAKVMLPALAVAALAVVADPIGMFSDVTGVAARRAFSVIGGGIYIASNLMQSTLTAVTRKVSDFDATALATGFCLSLGWLAYNIVLGDIVVMGLNLLSIASLAPLYYLKAKEVKLGEKVKKALGKITGVQGD